MLYDEFREDCPVDPDLTTHTWGEGGWKSEDVTITEGPEGTVDLWLTPASRPPRVATTGSLKFRMARSAVEQIGRRLVQAAGGGYLLEEAFKAGYGMARRGHFTPGTGEADSPERSHAAWVQWLEEWS